MKHRGLRVSVLLFGVALLATLAMAAAMTGVANAQSQTLEIGGGPTWTDTGVNVTSGETLTITASGTIYFRRSAKLGADPTGGTCAVAQDRFTAPGLTCYSLIGKVGPSGAPFEVGSSYNSPFPSTGELYLLANDNVGAFGNNTGVWTVAISTTTTTTTVVTAAAVVTPPTSAAPAVTHLVTSPASSLAFTGFGEGFRILALAGVALLLLGSAMYFFGGEIRRTALWLLRR